MSACDHPQDKQMATTGGTFCLACGTQTSKSALSQPIVQALPTKPKPAFGVIHQVAPPPASSLIKNHDDKRLAEPVKVSTEQAAIV